MKKLTVLFLVAAMIFTSFSFVSCGGDGDDTTAATVTGGGGGEGGIYDPELSPTDWGGKEFVILANTGYWGEAFDFESESEDPVDTAVYMRNRAVEQKYGVKIVETKSDSASTAVQTAFKSGSDDYDACYLGAYQLAPLASTGIFHDLTTVENLNLEKGYWDQALIRDLSVDNKIFYATGDLFTTPLQGTFLMLFNKKLQENYDLPDFYQMVRDNKWTIDYLTQVVNDMGCGYVDNGDGAVGVEDTFGLGVQEEVYIGFFYGLGGRLTLKDTNDLPVMNINNQTTVTYIDLINKLTRTGNNAIDAHEWLDVMNGDFASVAAFDEGRCLFLSTNASNIASFREMEDDFGVLPMPMLNEEQGSYYSFAYNGSNLVAIPILNTEDIAFTGFVLEALAAESYKTVTPAYYTQTLKGKYQRDEESYEMLDIAVRNRIWDFAYICGFGSIFMSFTNQIRNGSGTFTSFVRRAERTFQSDLDEYVEAYEKSSEN